MQTSICDLRADLGTTPEGGAIYVCSAQPGWTVRVCCRDRHAEASMLPKGRFPPSLPFHREVTGESETQTCQNAAFEGVVDVLSFAATWVGAGYTGPSSGHWRGEGLPIPNGWPLVPRPFSL